MGNQIRIIHFGPGPIMAGPGWGGWLVGLLFVLVVVVLVAWAIMVLTRHWDHRYHQAPMPSGPANAAAPTADPKAEALRILDERLARGEIDPEDYTNRRRLLTGKD